MGAIWADLGSFWEGAGGAFLMIFYWFFYYFVKIDVFGKIGVQERSGSEKERKRVPKGRQNEVKNETKMTSKF